MKSVELLDRPGYQRRGLPPPLDDICDAAGLTRPTRVSHQLHILQSKGYLDLPDDAERPCTLEGRLPGHPALRLEAGDLTDTLDVLSQDADYVLVPVIGQIPAGDFNLAELVFQDAFLLARQVVGEGALFMLKVAGDSMIDAAIADGDWVVIRQQEDAENGEIVAAMIDEEVTVKALQLVQGHRWLVPHNQDYKPIPGDRATILGKVVGVVRQS
jgi:repressor LexA